MSLVSMTGFGVGEAVGSGVTCSVELSSVNRKQFDLRISLPPCLVPLDAGIQELLRRGISRGQVSAQIRLRPVAAGARPLACLDMVLAAAYVRDLRQAAGQLGLRDDLGISALAALPGVVRSVATDPDPAVIWPVVRRALREALAALTAMRRAEGGKLEQELHKRLKRLRGLHAGLRRRAPGVPRRYRDQLRARLEEALGTPVRDEQLLREVAMLAERCDVTEEMVRLASHFDQCDELLASGKPVGRALDFLCQELLREINTTGSKCGDASMSAAVVHFKAELEMLREQAQNIE